MIEQKAILLLSFGYISLLLPLPFMEENGQKRVEALSATPIFMPCLLRYIARPGHFTVVLALQADRVLPGF